jgi:hypothetical protein
MEPLDHRNLIEDLQPNLGKYAKEREEKSFLAEN